MIKYFLFILIQFIEDLLIGGFNALFFYLFPTAHPRCIGWWIIARWLQWLTFLWFSVGLIVLCSASYPSALIEFGDGLYYVKRQLIWSIIGLIQFNILIRLPIKLILRFAGYGMIGSVILLALTFFMGMSINGAVRWISIGPILLQPSEIVKPFLVLQSAIIFGMWNAAKPPKIKLFWIFIFVFVLISILLQPNLSTSSLCALILWLVALTAGVRWFYLNLITILGFLTALISLGLREYQRLRIISFLNPWANPTTTGYQLVQSLLAVGSGGLTGSGLSSSYQKLYFLPIQYTDFIFSVFAEEFGLLGSSFFIIFLLSYFTLGIIVILSNTSENRKVHRLLAFGSLVALIGQSILNIGVSIGILPTTGLPLPFFSYGGNSLLVNFFLSAILVRVAIETEKRDRLNIKSILGYPYKITKWVGKRIQKN
uniref:peptidoglycan glycosyltransferase n=1 Tax=Chlorokybus atmophyticus TaxID=3144 RepID=A2CI73_CHLAT|nr:putative cell/organelle division protein [Chlorokybus atmophyticus]ABM87955.1 putative cell/organelle division protein [Chlorokybus atmophyticus]